MANTYTLIASSTVGSGGAANIEFTSIPSTYTDLLVKVSVRMTSSFDLFWIRFNGLTTNLSGRSVQGDGSGVSSFTVEPYGRGQSNTTTSNTFSSTDFYVPNYAGSNYKSISTDSVSENNATQAYAALGAGLWSASSAITSIQIVPNGGDTFVQHSSAYLYGISNS
jgi:hypothetical protein